MNLPDNIVAAIMLGIFFRLCIEIKSSIFKKDGFLNICTLIFFAIGYLMGTVYLYLSLFKSEYLLKFGNFTVATLFISWGLALIFIIFNKYTDMKNKSTTVLEKIIFWGSNIVIVVVIVEIYKIGYVAGWWHKFIGN